MKRLVILGLVAALAVTACSRDRTAAPGENTPPAGFQKLSYQEALKKGRQDGRVVLLDFSAEDCVYCRKLEAETFPDERVQAFLKDKTVAIQINLATEGALARQFGVTGIPCLVVLDGQGDELGRIEGYDPPASFLRKAEAIVSGAKGS